MKKIHDLCELIKVCGQVGVSRLEFDNVKVVFGPEQTILTPANVPTILQGEPEPITKDEVELREEQLSMALIENPVEYERLLTSGDLENGPEDN